jgi:hypothetical protein
MFLLRCSLSSRINGGYSAPEQKPSQASFSFLSFNRSCSSLYSVGADQIENNSLNRSTIIESRSYRTDPVEDTTYHLLHCCVLQICCGYYLTKSVFADQFRSNGSLFCFHSSCLEQICQISSAGAHLTVPFITGINISSADASSISNITGGQWILHEYCSLLKKCLLS